MTMIKLMKNEKKNRRLYYVYFTRVGRGARSVMLYTRKALQNYHGNRVLGLVSTTRRLVDMSRRVGLWHWDRKSNVTKRLRVDACVRSKGRGRCHQVGERESKDFSRTSFLPCLRSTETFWGHSKTPRSVRTIQYLSYGDALLNHSQAIIDGRNVWTLSLERY